jgi:hypothetical protein
MTYLDISREIRGEIFESSKMLLTLSMSPKCESNQLVTSTYDYLVSRIQAMINLNSNSASYDSEYHSFLVKKLQVLNELIDSMIPFHMYEADYLQCKSIMAIMMTLTLSIHQETSQKNMIDIHAQESSI